jgi:hypothetical protein
MNRLKKSPEEQEKVKFAQEMASDCERGESTQSEEQERY